MSERKWTKGEWVAVRNSVYWEVEAISDDGGWIGSVGDVCASSPSDPNGGEQEANARLFAASKEMYKTLALIADSIDGPAWAIDAAKAAMAKAEGQS